MNNKVSITELLQAIGSDNIQCQYLTNCIADVKSENGDTFVTFGTTAITAADIAMNAGPYGIVLWVAEKQMMLRLGELKRGIGLTYEKLLQQRDDLLGLLEEARYSVEAYAEERCSDELEALLRRIDVAIAKAKGGAS